MFKVWVLRNFLSSLYLFASFFQRWFGLISCMIVLKECFPEMIIAIETRKRHFLIDYRKNIIKNKSRHVSSLKDSRQEKSHNFKNVHFLKKRLKVKNWILLNFMTTFHNLALKIEIIWIKRLHKSILETRCTNDCVEKSKKR